MPATSVPILRLIAQKLCEELLIKTTCFRVDGQMQKISNFGMALLFLKKISNKAGAHLEYVCIICVNFKMDSLDTVERVDYTNLTSCSSLFIFKIFVSLKILRLQFRQEMSSPSKKGR